jgi:hypothetical protein
MQRMKKDMPMTTAIEYIVFPFTCLSRKKVEWLSTLLGPPTLIQPSERLSAETARMQQDGLLRVKTPVSGKEEALCSRMEASRGFHQGHPQSDMAFLKALAYQKFDDESLSAQIRSEILRYGLQTADPTDPLLDAMVFLRLAEEFDMQEEAIEEDLKRVEDLERDFLKKLGAEEEEPLGELLALPAGAQPKEEAEPHLPDERLRAWSILAGQDVSSLPAVWLTTSRLVMESLLDALPGAGTGIQRIALPDIENEPPASVEKWRTFWSSRMAAMLSGEDEPVNEPEGAVPRYPKGWLDVHPCRSLSPADILSALAPRSADGIQKSGAGDCGASTVILYCSRS